MVNISVIETARLRLRGHRPGDLNAAAAKWADPVVTRFTGGRPFTREESWARLLRYTGHWEWYGYGYWAVDDRETGHYIGELGFAHFERAIDPPISVPEAGWSFAAAAHGRGLATESLHAALAWGDRHLGAAKTSCIIDPANLASIHLARRCGYVDLGMAQYKGSPTLLLERLTPN